MRTNKYVIATMAMSLLFLCLWLLKINNHVLQLRKEVLESTLYSNYLEKNMLIGTKLNSRETRKELLKNILCEVKDNANLEGITAVLYYGKFDCSSCKEMALNNLKDIKNTEIIDNIIIATEIENARKLEVLSNMLHVTCVNYQNHKLNKLRSGKPLLLIIDQDLISLEVVIIDDRFPFFLKKFLEIISNKK